MSTPISDAAAADNIKAMKLAFIVDIAHWPEGRCVIYSHSESMACSYACQSAKEAGYRVDRSEFSAKRSPEYDRFASELKWNWGYDFEYLQGRIFSRLDELERNTRTPDLDAEGAAMREALKECEWVQHTGDNGMVWSECPSCGSDAPKHSSDCKIAKALASTAGELLNELESRRCESQRLAELIDVISNANPDHKGCPDPCDWALSALRDILERLKRAEEERDLRKQQVAYCQTLFTQYGLDDAAPIESHARTMVKIASERDNLKQQLASVTAERDETDRRLADYITEEDARVARELNWKQRATAAESVSEGLRAKIDAAPHASDCSCLLGSDLACDCWKASSLGAMGEK